MWLRSTLHVLHLYVQYFLLFEAVLLLQQACESLRQASDSSPTVRHAQTSPDPLRAVEILVHLSLCSPAKNSLAPCVLVNARHFYCARSSKQPSLWMKADVP